MPLAKTLQSLKTKSFVRMASILLHSLQWEHFILSFLTHVLFTRVTRQYTMYNNQKKKTRTAVFFSPCQFINVYIQFEHCFLGYDYVSKHCIQYIFVDEHRPGYSRVMRRTVAVDVDRHFDNLSASHLQSQGCRNVSQHQHQQSF